MVEMKLVRRNGQGGTNDPWRYWLETDADREEDRFREEFDKRFALDPPRIGGVWD